jgi:SAM-dependent methyltransferase
VTGEVVLLLIDVALGLFLVSLIGFGVGPFVGAPYLPVLKREVGSLLELADVKPGQLLLDLGSGDGRLLLAAAKRGVRGLGYEINPLLYCIAYFKCWPYRHLVKLRLANYWTVKLPAADIIYVFLIGHYMEKLDQKLQREVTRPTKLVSFVFEIPKKQPVRRTRNSFLYLYPTAVGDEAAALAAIKNS